MAQTCQACRGEVRDQRLCSRCQRITLVDLAAMPEYVRELVTVLTKQTNYQAKSDGGRATDPALAWAGVGDQFLSDHVDDKGKFTPGLDRYLELNPITTPYAKAAAACLHDLKATLVAWTKLLQEEAQVPFPANTRTALARHLARHMPLLANHEAAGEFVAEITKLVRRIMVVIDSPQFRSKIPVGPCIQVLDDETGEECPGEVVAYTYRDEDLIGTMACRTCKKEWAPREWLQVGPQILRKKDAAA